MSTPQYRRSIAFIAVALLVTGWVYTSTLELRGAKLAQQIATKKVDPDQFAPIPLSAEPTRTAAQILLATRSKDHERIDNLLAHSLEQRPLYAPYWLDRAEAAHRAGNLDAAEQYLETAAQLWPNRPRLLWRITMLQVRMGQPEGALATLRQYLRIVPRESSRVLAVASRMEPDPAVLLPAMLPDRIDYDQSRDDLVWRILRTARSQDNTPLGQAAWREFSDEARRDPEHVRYYVGWMVALDNQPEALAAWRTYRSTPDSPILENGGFERRLDGGLDWRSRARDGVTLTRDRQTAYAGQYSLKAAFSGTENVHFAHLRQYLPVQPAMDYTLSFAWRGDGITTRSGPFVDVRGLETGRIAHTEDRWGSWDWERRELSFTAPGNEHFVEVRLRRNRTGALDNEIGGTLWLDDFRLTPQGGEARSG